MTARERAVAAASAVYREGSGPSHIYGALVDALERAELAELEVEQLRREIAHLRHRDDHLSFGGGTLGVGGAT